MNSKYNPYAAPSSQIEQVPKNVQLSYFKSWVIYFVIVTVGGLISGFIAGAIAGAILSAVGVSIQTIQITAGVIGFILGGIISFFTFKWSVKKFLIDPMFEKLK